MADADPTQSASPIPLGPHNATRYGEGWKDYDFFAPDGRRDGIPIITCFCGRRRPGTGGAAASSTAWCECGIEWTTTWGRLTWVDRSRHVARPEGVVA